MIGTCFSINPHVDHSLTVKCAAMFGEFSNGIQYETSLDVDYSQFQNSSYLRYLRARCQNGLSPRCPGNQFGEKVGLWE